MSGKDKISSGEHGCDRGVLACDIVRLSLLSCIIDLNVVVMRTGEDSIGILPVNIANLIVVNTIHSGNWSSRFLAEFHLLSTSTFATSLYE